nr:stage II sporulation protein D [Oceanobacillus luteolus]
MNSTTRREFVKSTKKKINLQKHLKKKLQSQSSFRKSTITSAKTKLTPSFKPKGSVYFRHHQYSYRLPIIISILLLLTLILVVPSLIVLPLGNKSEITESVEETTLEDENPEAVSVAVMRTKADVVEDVPLEDYIVGVVAAEMSADFELEALKAQALAARTYTVSHLLGGNKEEEFDITDTVQHQVYKNNQELQQQWGSNYETNLEKIKAAVEATKGQIITYNEDPITPAYFSMSNGFTENSEDYWENEVPYLRSVPSPWDLENPKLVSQETFSKDELEKLLEVDIPNGKSNDILIARNDSGRVSEFVIEGNTFTGREVRDKLALRSSDFSVKQNNDHFIFTTKGYGHGIGMSQFGADAMAKEGKSYEEIVKYYYQGVEISTLDEAAPTLVLK